MIGNIRFIAVSALFAGTLAGASAQGEEHMHQHAVNACRKMKVHA